MTVPYGKVNHRADRVAIFGTGRSLRMLDTGQSLENVTRIGVNSAVTVVTCDIFFTLDPDKKNRRLMKFPIAGVSYYAAVPNDYGSPVAQFEDHRARPESNVTFLRRSKTMFGLSHDPETIHTGNSAWGALQLAVLMGARKIALFGIDGMGEYIYGGTPRSRSLHQMPSLFSSARTDLGGMGIEVINGSPLSTVTCFIRVSPNEAATWIEGD